MSDLKLQIAFLNYDRTRALVDGTIKIDGVDASFSSADIVSDIFERMVGRHEFAVSELGLTFYLRTLDLDDPPLIALPVFQYPFRRRPPSIRGRLVALRRRSESYGT